MICAFFLVCVFLTIGIPHHFVAKVFMAPRRTCMMTYAIFYSSFVCVCALDLVVLRLQIARRPAMKQDDRCRFSFFFIPEINRFLIKKEIRKAIQMPRACKKKHASHSSGHDDEENRVAKKCQRNKIRKSNNRTIFAIMQYEKFA